MSAPVNTAPGFDPVERPRGYNSHPSGVETIEVTEHLGFCVGNAIKYLWRCDLKGAPVEDVRKAAWYVRRELQRRERGHVERTRVWSMLEHGGALSAFLAAEPSAFKRDVIELLWRAETWPLSLIELRRALDLITAEIARREAEAPTP